MTVVPDPAEQLSISQKLDFVIANQTQQNALITQLRSDFESIHTEITAVQEQVTLFAHSVKGGNAPGSVARRKVANEVSVSCIMVTFERLLFMGTINYDCLELHFFRLQSKHYIILQIISLVDLNSMLYLLCSTLLGRR